MEDHRLLEPIGGARPIAGGDLAGRARSAPELPFGHVPRTRLTDYIVRPYQAALTLIVGEAGSGKTTLAAEWARQASMPVGWVALDGTVLDEASFAGDLHRALQEAVGLDGAPGPRVVLPGSERSELFAAIRNLDRDACLVIDNWEAGPEPAVSQVVDDLLGLADSPLRLVVSGRRAPPLRLGRLRAQGGVRELGSQELRLTRSEAEAVIRELAPDELSPESIDRIVADAEGWVAGVVLQGLDLRRVAASTTPGAGEALTLDNVLDEYVDQELLASVPPEFRGFVLGTAGLPWLSTDLCGAALGVDVGATLGSVERHFPFLRGDTTHPGRFRYQPLVGESLRRIVRTSVPERVTQERARRAAAWLIAAGELEDAARIALEMPVTPAMVEAILPLLRTLADRSDFEALEQWFARVPESALEISLDLAWWSFIARVGSGSGRAVGAEALLNELEPRASVSGSALHIGRIYLGRGILASFAGREGEAREALIDALARLPAEAVVERMYATWSLGDLAFLDGRDDNAAAAYKEAEVCASQLPLDELWSWFVIAPGRANGYAIRGDVHSAITKYRLIIAEIPPYLEGEGIDAYLRCRLVSLLIERNDLDAAWREYARIEAAMGDEPHPWHRHAMLAKARLLLADGRRDEAEQWATEHLPRLRRLPGKTQMVHLLARIWLERAEYPMVESWLADIDTMESPWVRTFGDINYRLLGIGLDLARERYEEAATSAEELMAEAVSRRRWSEVVQLSARWAVALHCLDQRDRARDVLRAALDRGARGGFVRAFHVPGFDTLTMFADVWAERPEYQSVRHELRKILGHHEMAEGAMISKRELEVLRLVAAGRTNQQIANVMFISTNTVRNHLVRVSQRLHARNRQEAVARARELGVLE